MPIGESENLPKGLVKLEFQVTTPTMQKVADGVLNQISRGWDNVIKPFVLLGLKADGMGNVRLPSGNFYVNEAGTMKQAPLPIKPKGYTYCQRKGYDPKTKIGWIWVVID